MSRFICQILLLSLFSFYSFGQGVVVPSGGKISFTDTSSIVISNGGLVVHGTYTSDAEDISFTGTTAGIISGSTDFTVYHLTINNQNGITSQIGVLTVNELDIITDSDFIIDSGKAVTVIGDLTNDGTLTILSPNDDSISGSLITNGSIINNGSMAFQRWVSVGSTNASDYTWHSMGIPILGTTAGSHFTGDYVYSYSESDNSWINISSVNEVINPGTGYIVKTINNNKTYTFTGTLNTGPIAVNVSNTGPDADHGYNLISNPYPSPIDLELLGRTNVGNTIWIWDPATENYLTYQIGTGGDIEQYILPCQAFFIKVADDQTTGTVNFDNADRTHLTGGNTFKKASVSLDKLDLKISGNGFEDHVQIFNHQYPNDGYKLFSMNLEVPQLYVIESSQDYGIYNIQELSDSCTLQLGLKSSRSGEYSIRASENTFAEDIILRDKLLGKEHDLSSNKSYTFLHQAESNANRFELIFSTVASAYSNNRVEPACTIMAIDNKITVATSASEGNIYIYTINGQLLKKTNIESSIQTIDVQGQGVYLVKVITKEQQFIEKVVLSK